MFARVKKSGKYQYLQIVENRKEAGKVHQQVIATTGRLDELQDKNRVEILIRSLSRFSENAHILSGKSDISAEARSMGPALISERLCRNPEFTPLSEDSWAHKCALQGGTLP